jgi:hypothetical protein
MSAPWTDEQWKAAERRAWIALQVDTATDEVLDIIEAVLSPGGWYHELPERKRLELDSKRCWQVGMKDSPCQTCGGSGKKEGNYKGVPYYQCPTCHGTGISSDRESGD